MGQQLGADVTVAVSTAQTTNGREDLVATAASARLDASRYDAFVQKWPFKMEARPLPQITSRVDILCALENLYEVVDSFEAETMEVVKLMIQPFAKMKVKLPKHISLPWLADMPQIEKIVQGLSWWGFVDLSRLRLVNYSRALHLAIFTAIASSDWNRAQQLVKLYNHAIRTYQMCGILMEVSDNQSAYKAPAEIPKDMISLQGTDAVMRDLMVMKYICRNGKFMRAHIHYYLTNFWIISKELLPVYAQAYCLVFPPYLVETFKIDVSSHPYYSRMTGARRKILRYNDEVPLFYWPGYNYHIFHSPSLSSGVDDDLPSAVRTTLEYLSHFYEEFQKDYQTESLSMDNMKIRTDWVPKLDASLAQNMNSSPVNFGSYLHHVYTLMLCAAVFLEVPVTENLEIQYEPYRWRDLFEELYNLCLKLLSLIQRYMWSEQMDWHDSVSRSLVPTELRNLDDYDIIRQRDFLIMNYFLNCLQFLQSTERYLAANA